MTLDSLLTLAGLLLAAYAIMPTHRQLGIRLRVGVPEYSLAIACFIAVYYLQFYPSFAGLDALLSRNGLTSQAASFLIVAITSVVIGFRVRKVSLKPRNIHKFSDLARELYLSSKYEDLSRLIEQHLQGLMMIYRSEFLSARLQRFLTKPPVIDERRLAKTVERLNRLARGDADDDRQEIRHRIASVITNVNARIAGALPAHRTEQEIAAELVHRLFTSEAFVSYVAKSTPYLGIRVLQQKFREKSDFLNLYLRALLADSSSILYYEIENSQETRGCRCIVPSRSRLLRAILEDSEFAEKNAVYKLVGDAMLLELDALYRSPASDPYNLPIDDFEETGQWRSSLCTGVRFFEIMVSAALFKGTEWHMWLYYFVPLTKRVCRNYRITVEQGASGDSWPNRYTLLLHQMFSAMETWIAALSEVPLDQANVCLESVSTKNENGNIPKSSILCLARCLKALLVAERIPDDVKCSIAEEVLRLYFTLRTTKRLESYAAVLLLCIVTVEGSERIDEREYRRHLLAAFGSLDKYHYDQDIIDTVRASLAGTSE